MTPTGGARKQLSEILGFEKTFDDTAQDIADLARSSLVQCDGVGMQLLDADGLTTRVFTDTRSLQFDALQQLFDEGPCVSCLRTGEVRVPSYPIFFRNGVRFCRNSLFGLAPAGSLCA